jgi:5-methylcytosine-specific restriction enzyme A
MLFIQPNGGRIEYAAVVPLAGIAKIWVQQRAESARMIKAGLDSRRKNRAENGRSPTIWLRDDRAPTVASAFWNAPGVVDLMRARTPRLVRDLPQPADDTFDDLPGLDPNLFGSDAPSRTRTEVSSVKRDVRVRRFVLKRARGKCERTSCGASRAFRGFLDVHHILGAHKADRIWNCVALCPNCHREAHFSPDSDAINADLLRYSVRFRGKT